MRIKEYHQQIWDNGIIKEIIITDSNDKEISHNTYDTYGDYISTYYIDEKDDWAQTGTSLYEYGKDSYTCKSSYKQLNGTQYMD